MTDVIKFMRVHPSSWFIGIGLGLALALGWPALVERYDNWYDGVNPPAIAEAVNPIWHANDVEFTLLVKRQRADCEYKSRIGYSMSGTRGLPREMRSARLDETDGIQRIVQRPVGVWIDTGRWRMWPTADATSIELWALYVCGERQVQAKLVSLGVPLNRDD